MHAHDSKNGKDFMKRDMNSTGAPRYGCSWILVREGGD